MPLLTKLRSLFCALLALGVCAALIWAYRGVGAKSQARPVNAGIQTVGSGSKARQSSANATSTCACADQHHHASAIAASPLRPATVNQILPQLAEEVSDWRNYR